MECLKLKKGEIEKGKGHQFDPKLADIALEILREENPSKVN